VPGCDSQVSFIVANPRPFLSFDRPFFRSQFIFIFIFIFIFLKFGDAIHTCVRIEPSEFQQTGLGEVVTVIIKAHREVLRYRHAGNSAKGICNHAP
jgi:hypothetical protein